MIFFSRRDVDVAPWLNAIRKLVVPAYSSHNSWQEMQLSCLLSDKQIKKHKLTYFIAI